MIGLCWNFILKLNCLFENLLWGGVILLIGDVKCKLILKYVVFVIFWNCVYKSYYIDWFYVMYICN